MTRKKVLISIFAIIVVLASIIFIIQLTINGYIIENERPEIYGNLNFSEVDSQNHIITFSVNISYRNVQQAYIEQTDTVITIIHNDNFLNNSDFNWEYIDVNNDGLINSGDNVVVRLRQDYSGLIEVYLHLPGFRGTLYAEYEGDI